MTSRARRFGCSSAGLSDAGRVRKVNQDAFLDRPDLGIWGVADGMGGHSDGAHASRLLVDRLALLERPTLLGAASKRVASVLMDVNRRLIEEAIRRDLDIIGTTVVALIAVGDHCAILWAGDSRVYRLRDGELTQLTTDHTQVQEMVEQGVLTREQAEYHPMSNVLVRAVGGDLELTVDKRVEGLRGGDRFLLCSDGLTKELPARLIARLLGQADPDTAARSLVQAACDSGGRDNVTAVVVEFLGEPEVD